MVDSHRGKLRAVDDQLGRVESRIGSLAATLAGVADHIAELAAGDDGLARYASWFEIDDAPVAYRRLTDLVTWLDQVYLQFPDAALPTCWLWHPSVVEELLWLRRSWLEAFTGRTAAVFRVADWHDRQRSGVVARIRALNDGVCSLDQHDRGAERDGRPPNRPRGRCRAGDGRLVVSRSQGRSALPNRCAAGGGSEPAVSSPWRREGFGWAYVGVALGGTVSIAANVAHSFVPPLGAPPGWRPMNGAVLGAVFWPVALFVAIEILARTDWPAGVGWRLVRLAGLLPVAIVAAVVSYRHLSGLIAYYGEDGLTATAGPLAVDGLMAVASAALIASSQPRSVAVASPDPYDTLVDEPASQHETSAVEASAGVAEVDAMAVTSALSESASSESRRVQLDQARAYVQAELAAGRTPSGAAVGRRYGRNSRWGQRMVREVLVAADDTARPPPENRTLTPTNESQPSESMNSSPTLHQSTMDDLASVHSRSLTSRADVHTKALQSDGAAPEAGGGLPRRHA
jgi:hypothetical protein